MTQRFSGAACADPGNRKTWQIEQSRLLAAKFLQLVEYIWITLFLASNLRPLMQGSAYHTATIHAQKLLGDERVIAFLRAASFRSGGLAIDLANGFLRDGRSVSFILSPPMGGSTGFTLFAHYIQRDVAHIEFALWTDRQKRSSSKWEVRFAKNEVVELIDAHSAPLEFAPSAQDPMLVV